MKKIYRILFLLMILFGTLSPAVKVGAASGVILTLKEKKASLNKKTLAVHVGEKDAILSYMVNGQRKKMKGQWSSSNKRVIKIDQKGRCKALNNGISTIRFTFLEQGKKQSVYCKIRVFTKPEKVELMDVNSNFTYSVMKPKEDKKIEIRLIPSDKALRVNSTIKSNYKVSYELFSDSACTELTDLGTVDVNGVVRSKEFGGTMYLRAVAKADEKLKFSVFRKVQKIVIEGMTAEEKRLEDEKIKKEAEAEREREKLRPARIEIKDYATIQRGVSIEPNLLYAQVRFKLYDGNGKDITYDSSVRTEGFSAFWNDTAIPVQRGGIATITLITNIPGQPQNIGTVGKVSVKYRELNGKEIFASKQVRIDQAGIISKADVKGIYRYSFDEITKTFRYENVLDKDTVRLKKGDKITNFGNHIALNAVPGAYYLLIDAVDSYNEFVTDMGIKESFLNIQLIGKNGLEIDESMDYTGKKSKQSIYPIVIDGRPYLTYPLKATTVDTGELQVVLQGGYVRNVFSKMISDGTSMIFFNLTGLLADSSERIQVGRENSLAYFLTNSKGEIVKDFDQVLYHLKLTDTFRNGTIFLPSDSEIFSSEKNSFFKIRKNPSNHQAEIIYTPQMNVLLTGNPNFPLNEFGVDEVTVLRGFGENLEQKVKLYVWKSK